jgi:hypothetical protein
LHIFCADNFHDGIACVGDGLSMIHAIEAVAHIWCCRWHMGIDGALAPRASRRLRKFLQDGCDVAVSVVAQGRVVKTEQSQIPAV